jgi:hypothetical protein
MPRTLRDFHGLEIRLTDERLAHILEHPEMIGMEAAIEETLKNPVQLVESLSDPHSRMYYRHYTGTKVGDKHLCVVVKVTDTDAFVLTAYLTNKMKQGKTLWAKEN